MSERRVLDDALATVTRRFPDEAQVPLRPHWGGWRIVPEQVEFWQGRPTGCTTGSATS